MRASLSIVFLLALATPADATPYFVGPGSTRQALPCPRETPCDLAWALDQSTSGDTITALAGEYALAAHLPVSGGVTLQGEPGPRPVITLTGFRLLVGASQTDDPVATVRHVEVHRADGGAAVDASFKAVVDDMVVVSSSPGPAKASGISVSNDGARVTNSVAIASGPNAQAVNSAQSSSSNPSRLVNVTALATGTGSVGVWVENIPLPNGMGGCFALPGYLALTNVIARGDTADLGVKKGCSTSSASSAKITVDHSNYRVVTNDQGTVEQLQGNQTTPAQVDNSAIFLDQFRQKSGAPTIDAGVAHALTNNSFDPDGDLRIAGPLPDIGADEFPLLPLALTGGASGISPAGVTLEGTATANARITRAVIEWGTTTAYGNLTGEQEIPAGAGPVALSGSLASLAPATTYHYRTRAANAASPQAQEALGEDKTFTTLAAPGPGGLPPELLAKLVVAKKISLRALRRKGLRVRFTLGVAGSAYEIALVSPQLKKKSATAAETRRLARRVKSNVPAGPVDLRLRVKRKALRGIKPGRKATFKITVGATDRAPVIRTLKVKLTRR